MGRFLSYERLKCTDVNSDDGAGYSRPAESQIRERRRELDEHMYDVSA
jgi:hypothetical protein